MLTLCWFYCIDLAKFIYFATGPFFLIFALFALKRGVRRNRKGLRQAAFFMMFGAVLKICLFDIRALAPQAKEKICRAGIPLPRFDCGMPSISPQEVMVLSFLGLVLLVFSSFVLFQFYRVYLPERRVREVTPDEVHLRFWVNTTLWMVILMALWTAAPWIASLVSESGQPPRVFATLRWQHFAMMNIVLVAVCFWKLESCVWETKVTDDARSKARRAHLQNTWTPRDTLWMALFLFVLTLALSYVAWDITKPRDRNAQPKSTFSFRSIIPDVDTSNPMLTK